MVVRIVLNHLGEVCGGTNSLRSSWWGLWWYKLVLDHLGGVCGGTNSLKSSWWGLCY